MRTSGNPRHFTADHRDYALEEEGDRLFIESMRRLHAEVTDPIEIIAWREIYVYLEKCCDACEHVADVVESVIMKNT